MDKVPFDLPWTVSLLQVVLLSGVQFGAPLTFQPRDSRVFSQLVVTVFATELLHGQCSACSSVYSSPQGNHSA